MDPMMPVKGAREAAWPYQLAEEMARALTPAGEMRRLECGERLFSFGDVAEGVYLITQGTARATLPGETGGELVGRTAGAGSVLGLPSALCSNRYQFDVEALEALEAVFLPTGTVNEILRGQPELCMLVMNMMCDELNGLKQTCDHMRNCAKESCSLHEQCRQRSGLQ